MKFSPENLKMPNFFANSEKAAPTPSEFKNWPLVESYSLDLTHVAEKPRFMQPKQNHSMSAVDTFFVSPRMIIRRLIVTNEEFPYADCLSIEAKITMT